MNTNAGVREREREGEGDYRIKYTLEPDDKSRVGVEADYIYKTRRVE